MPHLGEFQALQPQSPSAQAVTAGASPFSYSAPAAGRVVVSVGTVTLIELGRRGAFVSAGVVAGALPVSAGDVVRVTYAVAPTMTFIPT